MLQDRPTREAVGFTTLLTAETSRGAADLIVPLAIELEPVAARRRLTLEGHVHSLTIRLENWPEHTAIRWWLSPNRADATARADLLDFLWVLSGDGALTVSDTRTGYRVGGMPLRDVGFEDDLSRDREFLDDIATIEEWTSRHLHLPEEVSAEETQRVAQAAQLIRDRTVPLRFTGEITAVTSERVEQADELHLSSPIPFDVLGTELALGTASGIVRVRGVSSTSREDGRYESVFVPIDQASRDVTWALAPPEGYEPGPRTGGQASVPAPGQEWFWSDKWQASEAESAHERSVGEVTRPNSSKAFLTYLEEHADDSSR
jgi:hypothetical protein